MNVKSAFIHIRVLKNGQMLAESRSSCNKNDTLSITNRSGKPLSVPELGLYEDILIGKTTKGKVGFTLTLKNPCQGFLVKSGERENLEVIGHFQKEYYLAGNEYASLRFNDIDVLIRVYKRPPRVKAKSKSTIANPLSLLAFDRAEMLGLVFGLFAALFIIICIYLGFRMRPTNSSLGFKNLAERYTLPFIHKDAIATSPEALKNNLNRNDYLYHTIRFYEDLTAMFLDSPGKHRGLIYNTTRRGL